MSPAEAENYAFGTQQTVSDVKDGMIPVKEGDIIDLGDRPLEIIDNPGHTPGSIAILEVKNRVLIGGAQEIIAGTADSTTTEWFGMKIRLFKFPYAGFLCDL